MDYKNAIPYSTVMDAASKYDDDMKRNGNDGYHANAFEDGVKWALAYLTEHGCGEK